jgi:heme exporter protein B
MLLNEIKELVRKEFKLEWRERYALNGLLLYIISAVFICYLSFQARSLDPITWNTLFWIILLFTAVNAIAKSFIQERAGRFFYYYVLASPHAIIFAKIIYNTFLMLLIAGIGFLVYITVIGNPIQNIPLFLLNLLLGSVGFSAGLTLIAGIASKVENSATLMSVLSFPVILPMLLMLIKVSKNAIDGLDWGSSYDEVMALISIDVLVLALSYLLFPFLWRA